MSQPENVRAPLEGVKVLDFTQLLPGAHTGMILADFGADVIKVEPPSGDPMRKVAPQSFTGDSARHRALNRGKRSYVANLKDPERLNRVQKLAQECNVVLESFRPGVMERLGLGYEAVSTKNPRVVYASITGFGSHGKRSSQPSHDLNFIALSGLLDTTLSNRSLKPPAVQLGDLAGGSLPAIIGILLALRVADQTGIGQKVEISMFDGLVNLLGSAVADVSVDADSIPTIGRLSGEFACYTTYQCRDGHIAVGALEPKFWRSLVERIGHDELASIDHLDPDRQNELRRTLGAYFATLSVNEAIKAVGDDICVSPVRSFSELLRDDDLRSREVLVPLDATDGSLQSGIQPNLSKCSLPTPPPGEALGASTELINAYGWQGIRRSSLVGRSPINQPPIPDPQPSLEKE